MRKLSSTVFNSYHDWLWSIRLRLVSLHLDCRDLALYLNMDPANLSRTLTGVQEPGLSFYFRVEQFFKEKGL